MALSSSLYFSFDIAYYPCYYVIVILSFADQGTEDIYNGKNSASARRVCPQAIWKVAFRKLDQLDSATKLIDLSVPIGNRLEALSGNREGQHSIRINDQYRVCFHWTEAGPEAVEIVDYH
jgi:proteic killer suppression protein